MEPNNAKRMSTIYINQRIKHVAQLIENMHYKSK